MRRSGLIPGYRYRVDYNTVGDSVRSHPVAATMPFRVFSQRDGHTIGSILLAVCMLLCCLLVSVAGAADSTADTGPVSVRPQTDWSDAIIYFVLIDRFADGDSSNNQYVDLGNPGGYHGGDLKGLTQHLDEIASLGATAIWINPVVKQVDKGFPAQGPDETHTGSFLHWGFHGYWADDFNRIEPHFGSEADLKALVDAAHARGMKILLDVVFNHPGYESQYETNPATRGWIRKGQYDCADDPVHCQVGGLPDFRTEDEAVRDYLFNAHLGLAQRTGVDGFRIDTAKHISHEFLHSHRQASRARLGDAFFLLGEVWGGDAVVLDEWFKDDELDAGFDFGFRGNCEGFVDGRGRTIAYANYLKKRHKLRHGYYLAHYLSSHDEPMFLYELGGDFDKFKMCVALQMTTMGIPVIYYGEEVGRSGSVWPTNRRDMPWGERDIPPGGEKTRNEDLRRYYQHVIAIRRDHPALSHGDFSIVSGSNDPLLVFARKDGVSGDTVIVAANRTDKPVTASYPVPAGDVAGLQEMLAGGETAAVTDGRMSVSVPPKSVRVYTAM